MNVLSHCVTALVQAEASAAFAYLADPRKLGRWSLGAMDTRETEVPGLYAGTSLFDGGTGYFAVQARPEFGEIDWLIGPRGTLVHRISARVLAGPPLGHPAGTSLVTLIAWRPADMNDARWARLIATHEAEIHLIKAQIETERR